MPLMAGCRSARPDGHRPRLLSRESASAAGGSPRLASPLAPPVRCARPFGQNWLEPSKRSPLTQSRCSSRPADARSASPKPQGQRRAPTPPPRASISEPPSLALAGCGAASIASIVLNGDCISGARPPPACCPLPRAHYCCPAHYACHSASAAPPA